VIELVYAGHSLLAWKVVFDRKRDRGVCLYLLNFDGDLKVYVCVCVCICTRTHTLHVRYLDVSRGVGMRHMERPKVQ